RVVVVHQLEEEAEPAVVAGDGLVVEALLAVDVDRALLAVRADEVRHSVRLAGSDPLLAPVEPELEHGAADDHGPGVRIPVAPVEFGHVVEVLAVDTDDEGGNEDE